MIRGLLPPLAAVFALTATAAFAQHGGPGNIDPGGAAMASGPTLDDMISNAAKEVDQAEARHAISPHAAKAYRDKLKKIQASEEALGEKVAKIRRALPH